MVVLVVDDQVSVVSAILSGIDWRALGVETVHKAYNAFEAKDILRTKPVDIMLCDIEMPGEDGLSLYRWCGENGYELECVFLTSHADFHYAKEALRLGSFDYILQPARYEDVQATLQKVIQRVHSKNEEKKYYTYGKLVVKDSSLLLDAMLARWLAGGEDGEKIREDLATLGVALSPDGQLYPALLEILAFERGDAGNDAIFRYGLQNILAEIAGHYGCGVLLALRDEDAFCVLLYGTNGGTLEREKAQSLYNGLLELCARYYGCRMAAYAGAGVAPGALPGAIAELDTARRDNIGRCSQVFLPGMGEEAEAGREPGALRAFSGKRWLELLAEGDATPVMAEIDLYLNTLAAGEGAGAEELQHFYKEFMQLLFKALEARGRTLDDVFPDSESMQLFLRAYQSVAETRQMVYTALTALDAGERSGEVGQIDGIIRYIQDNLEKDIRRADVAAAVHLSQDYISHLFRKAMGVSLSEFITGEKMRVAKSLLATTALPVSVVAAKVGYSNFSYFSKTYKRVYGHSPAAERKGNTGEL